MDQLGRVNLLVGLNNSGKTSVLEAIELLTSSGELASVGSSAYRRGEQIFQESGPRPQREVDIRHLFAGHVIEPGSAFVLKGFNESERVELHATIEESEEDASETTEPTFFEEDSDEDILGPMALTLRWEGEKERKLQLPISRRGGVNIDKFRRFPTKGRRDHRVQFITTASLGVHQITSLFEEIVLTSEEEMAINALRTIAPNIERIATTGSARAYAMAGARGGVVVKCRGIDNRVPIGSLGDGIWRMLGIALALAGSSGGILLVDEIDTGLHYTVMRDMWRLVYETATRLDVQVFATTHSSDCFKSLATFATEGAQDIAIHRIEAGREHSIAYDRNELGIVAERGLEVR